MPVHKPNQVYVANHTSLIDPIVLYQARHFSLVGQRHRGFIGFCQDYFLGQMHCVWFDRAESKDRQIVARKIQAHISDPSKPPLLIFPEGTCVNNEYIVMFKRGAFDLGAAVVPIAIKYNKIFVDAYWFSRKQTFVQHLFRLMTAWAVVCDVYILEPQLRHANESAAMFAERVKRMIARKAGLIPVPWDGYLKHYQPKKSFLEARQRILASSLCMRFGLTSESLSLDKLGAETATRQSKPEDEEDLALMSSPASYHEPKKAKAQ